MDVRAWPSISIHTHTLTHKNNAKFKLIFFNRSRREQQHEKPQTFFSFRLQTKTEYFFYIFPNRILILFFVLFVCFFTSLASDVCEIKWKRENGNIPTMKSTWKISEWKITENTHSIHFTLLFEFFLQQFFFFYYCWSSFPPMDVCLIFFFFLAKYAVAVSVCYFSC